MIDDGIVTIPVTESVHIPALPPFKMIAASTTDQGVIASPTVKPI